MNHAPRQAIGNAVLFSMAAACAVTVANIYYNQPMLGVMQRAFPNGSTGLIPTATQLGYAIGLVATVPLGDVMDRRMLIIGQLLVLSLALAGLAAAPNAKLLVAASLAVGCAAAVAQQIVPFAASLAAPERRGAAVGIVMGGLLCGILLSRTLAGVVAASLGWRAMFWLAVPMTLAAAATMARTLPHDLPRPPVRYGQAMASLIKLWRGEEILRRATYVQSGLFAAFSVFWTILALHLEQPPFQVGPEIAGAFGVLGASGIVAAPIAGRLADRRGPRMAILFGAALACAAWLVFGLWTSLPGLVLGVLLLDFGVQSALISNQHVIYALAPEARSRINTVFMTGMFLGGGIGSAIAMLIWRAGGGWGAVSLLGFGVAALSLAIAFFGRRKEAVLF